MKLVILLLTLTMPLQDTSFKDKQLLFPRVRAAYSEKEITVKKYFNNKNLNYPGSHIYIRAFKSERVVEVWVKEQVSSKYEFLLAYPFCSMSGVLGPKRKEGDLQIPEGFYELNHFNPSSNFHLSLGINYPNRSDRLLGDKNAPGSAIYIHGNCVTVGCIPITDDKIKELYILAVEARNNGQKTIPVHIFPSKLSVEDFTRLAKNHPGQQSLLNFWKSLQQVYVSFEARRELPAIKVNAKGEYYL